MGLFGGGRHSISHEQTKLHGIRVGTSSFGDPLVLLFGTNRLSPKFLWDGDFTPIPHTTTESTGGKGGGGGTTTTNTTYTYNTALAEFLCVASPKIAGVLSLWDTKGNRKTLGKQLFNSTVPAVGPFTRQPTATGFLLDLGCGFVANRSVTANDYGDDSYGHGGRSVSIVGEVTPMVKVASAPAAGQYSVDGTGTYTFNSADASKTIQIQYIKLTGTSSPLGQYGFSLFDGSQSAAWGYLTSKHPGQDLVYKLFAYVVNQSLDCGESGTVPNFSYEVAGMLLYPGQLDALPKDIVNFILTDSVHGIAFPSANLDTLTAWSNWCVANGLFLSPVYDAQAPASERIQELCDLTNSASFWSEGKLKIIPFGDQTVIGNGATYTPNTAPIYDLTRDDFIGQGEVPPVTVTRASRADAYNSLSLEYLNRANDYNIEIIEERDSGQVELYGLRKKDPLKAHAVTQKTVASTILNMMLKRSTQNLQSIAFKLGVQYALLEPMDLVTVTIAELNFNKKPFRIVSISENDDRTYDIVAEEFPYASASATLYPKGEGAGYTPNTNNDPGDIATPFIYEPPVRATQDGLGNEIWVGAYGASADWGGADVWLSNDNLTYRQVGTIPGKMRSGITASTLAAAADPDTTNTVDVDLSTSGGGLVNATTTDCDNFRSLMLLNNELVSFKDVTLLGANQYRLGTRLRRGVYGTPIASHALSERAIRVDDNILRLKFKAEDVGQLFYLKFTSYNTFGRAEQQLANVTAYTFTLVGSSGGNDFIPTELVHDALVLQASATGAGTLLVQIAGAAYTIVAGDTLEYDIWIDPTSADFKAGADIIFGDATKIRGNGYRDQVPLSADPSTDLSAYAKSQWFHRKIDLSRAAGKVTATWMIGFDGSSVGFHRAKFANIRIMNGKTVKAVGWVTGVPAFSFVNTNINYTIGTTPLYSQNDGGQWYAMLTAGTSSGMNKQGSIVPATGTSGPFGFYSSDGGTANGPSAVVSWIGVTQYRPDGTNFQVSSSAALFPWQPDPPIVTAVAGGAKAAGTVWARCAYVKDGAIVGVGEATSLALLINTLLKVPSPVLSHQLAAVWSSDTFTDVAATLLENHVQTVSNGKRWIKDAGTSLKIDGTGTKLVPGASGINRYTLPDHPWYDGYAIQVDVDMTGSTVATDEMGVTCSVRDANNFYYIHLMGTGILKVQKCVGGAFTSLTTFGSGMKSGTLKVVVTMTSATNTKIEVYWNGVLQGTVNDTALPIASAHGARVGLMTNTPVLTYSYDNWSVTDAVVPPALAVDGWVPLVGTSATSCTAQIDPRAALALGTDWTEPVAGATHSATYLAPGLAGQNISIESGALATATWTWSGAKAWLNKLGSILLAYSSATVFYPTTDNNGAAPGFGTASGPAQPGTTALSAELFFDGRYPLCGSSGVSFTTPAAGGSGAGSGGGGCSRKDMIIKPIGQPAFGVDFFNEDWIEVECENGCSKVATPRDRVLSYDHGVLELQDWLVREGLTLITELGKSAIKSVRRFKEAGVAVNLEMNEGHLYWAGKENGKGILSSNLKP